MSKKFPITPKHPERICWGCDKYCALDRMHCGNGSERTPHPAELFGDDWMDWGLDAGNPPLPTTPATAAVDPDAPASTPPADNSAP